MPYDKNLILRVNDEVINALDTLAKKDDTSRASVVRRLVLTAFEESTEYEVISEGQLPHPPDAEAVKVVFVRRKES